MVHRVDDEANGGPPIDVSAMSAVRTVSPVCLAIGKLLLHVLPPQSGLKSQCLFVARKFLHDGFVSNTRRAF